MTQRGKCVGENDKRCRTVPPAYFLYQEPARPSSGPLGLNKTIRRCWRSALGARAHSLTPQLPDIDQPRASPRPQSTPTSHCERQNGAAEQLQFGKGRLREGENVPPDSPLHSAQSMNCDRAAGNWIARFRLDECERPDHSPWTARTRGNLGQQVVGAPSRAVTLRRKWRPQEKAAPANRGGKASRWKGEVIALIMLPTGFRASFNPSTRSVALADW